GRMQRPCRRRRKSGSQRPRALGIVEGVTATTLPTPEDVLDHWLGPLDAEGRAGDAHRARWFAKDAAFDRALSERFGPLLALGARGELDAWVATQRGRLALVILLDQFSR